MGSLARPTELLDTMKEKENDRPYDHELFDRQVHEAVADRVRRQVDCGIDIVTDGEMSKSSFLGYVKDRLGGFEIDTGRSGIAPSWQAEVDDFPEYYADYFKKYSSTVAPLRRLICTGPITYVGQELAAEGHRQPARPRSRARTSRRCSCPPPGRAASARNEYYDTDEEYLHNVAEAMREEYQAIVDAGFVLQVDDPFLIGMLSDPTREPAEQKRAATVHVEALNHALRDIPTDRVRHHTCYGLNHGPRIHDIPLADALEYTLQIDAGAYSFEVANPRHMHEWRVWETVKLPEGKIIIPGLLGHANNYVEHPELIAEYIVKYAGLVGKENVIAGADCGFSSGRPHSPEVHPTVVWPKFEALAAGAAIATKELWG